MRWPALLALALVACGPTDYERNARIDAHVMLVADVDTFYDAVVELHAAAPEPTLDGWAADMDAILAMRAAWARARDAYERIEPFVAALAPDLHAAIDGSYESFVELEPDNDLFDGEGVVGLRAIERILWSDAHPDEVLTFESALARYREATFARSRAQAESFRDGLARRLLTDAMALSDRVRATSLEPDAAFHALIETVRDQQAEIGAAGTGAEESRYSQTTLADLRANTAGARAGYDALAPWLLSMDGDELDGDINASFDRISQTYDGLDALPDPPLGWTPDDRASDYGMLFAVMSEEASTTSETSLVTRLRLAAELLGYPTLP